MSEVQTFEISQHETRLSKELSYKTKFKAYQHDYKMFSNVIQKSRRTIELRKILSKQRTKVIEENAPFNHIVDTNNNMVTSPVLLKSKRMTLLLDVNLAIDFLDYGNRSITDAFSLFSKTLDEVNKFKNYAKYIEIALHNVRHSGFFKKLDGKINDDDFETEIGLNDDILVTTRDLLINLQEAIKSLNYAMERYFMNLQIISNAVSMFCSLSIETELDDNRDLMYAVIKQVDYQINKAHETESEVYRYYDKQQPKLLELHNKSSEFINLYSKLTCLRQNTPTNHLSKLACMVFQNGF